MSWNRRMSRIWAMLTQPLWSTYCLSSPFSCWVNLYFACLNSITLYLSVRFRRLTYWLEYDLALQNEEGLWQRVPHSREDIMDEHLLFLHRHQWIYDSPSCFCHLQNMTGNSPRQRMAEQKYIKKLAFTKAPHLRFLLGKSLQFLCTIWVDFINLFVKAYYLFAFSHLISDNEDTMGKR